MARKKKEPFVDDGRTIANMNVPGMPWYLDGPKVQTDKIEKTEDGQQEDTLAGMELTKGERRAMIKGALAAVLPIGAFFAIAYTLILLFMDFVWLS